MAFRIKKGVRQNLPNDKSEDTMYICDNGEVFYDYSNQQRIKFNEPNIEYISTPAAKSDINASNIGIGEITLTNRFNAYYELEPISITRPHADINGTALRDSNGNELAMLIIEKNNNQDGLKTFCLFSGYLSSGGAIGHVYHYFNASRSLLTLNRVDQLYGFLNNNSNENEYFNTLPQITIDTSNNTISFVGEINSEAISEEFNNINFYIIKNNMGLNSFINLGYDIITNSNNINVGRNIADLGTNNGCFGQGLINNDNNSLVIGQYNSINRPYKFSIGNGSSYVNRTTVFGVTNTGNVNAASYSSNGADYAEYFEWKEIPKEKDLRGLFVTLEKNKIRLANKDDNYILGIISANPSIIGNSSNEEWQGKYKTDIFGCKQLDDNGKEIINSNYNSNEQYKSRKERAEWALVGLLGQIVVVDDGSCVEGEFCGVGENGIATAANNGYYVMERLDDNHIKILFK